MTEPNKFLLPLCLVLIAALWAPGYCQSAGAPSTGSLADQFFVDQQFGGEKTVSELGTRVIYDPPVVQPDYFGIIAYDFYDPRVSNAHGSYYCIGRVSGNPYSLMIYKTEGDPANSTWTYYTTLISYTYVLDNADILAIPDADRLYVVYTVGTTAVEIFGCRKSNPNTHRVVTVSTGTNMSNCSICQGGVPTDPYLFVCWKEGSGAKAAASYDIGYTWTISNVASSGVAEMYTGNAIDVCSDSLLVCVYYQNTSNQGIVARSGMNFNTSSFVPRTALTNLTDVGGIACYSNTALVTGVTGTFGDCDVVYSYSTTDGYSWASPISWSEQYDQRWPSVTSNSNGYYCMLYCSWNASLWTSPMTTKRNTYNNLGGSWTVENSQTYGEEHTFNSACIEDGASPHYGGACNGYGDTPPTVSIFCWAGSLDRGSGKSPSLTADEVITNAANGDAVAQERFKLRSSPNPFNSTTTIGFHLSEAGLARLAVYDLSGRLVKVLLDGYRPAGDQQVEFSPRSMAGGVYLYCLEAGQSRLTQKLVYLK